MPAPRFLQVHTLTSYPAVLLNRDDAGLAKRLPYGGTVRTRVSSQCLKRHWRMIDEKRPYEYGLRSIPGLTQDDFAARSRRHFSDAIARPLVERGADTGQVVAAVKLVLDRALKSKGDGRTGGDKDTEDSEGDARPKSGKAARKGKAAASDSAATPSLDSLETKQAFILTSGEVHYLTSLVERLLGGDTVLRAALEEKQKQGNPTPIQKEMADALGKNLEQLGHGARVPRSVDASLYGRMITSDVMANTDAAIHVAHAFTIHHQESETDYFTVVDDLKSQDAAEDAGSAGIFDTELTSGLFYGYVVVDVPLLVSNLTGIAPERWAGADVDRALPAKVVEHLLHLIATVSPGAKKGSTAPYAWTQCMLVEAGARQPRTLASAFEQAVRATPQRSLSYAGEEALFDRLAAFDRAYGAREARGFLSLAPEERAGARGPLALDELAAWAAATIANDDAASRS